MTSNTSRLFPAAGSLGLAAALMLVLASCGGGDKPCIERVEAGADLQGCDLSGADLSGQDLSGAELSGATLNGADLSEANLEEATLESAMLQEVDLTGANLEKADLSGADLTEAVAIDAVFREANLTGSTLVAADFADADFLEAILTGADLSSADLTRAVMTRAEMQDANITGGTLRSAALGEANLAGATLVRAGLDGSTFTGADLSEADLSASVLANSDLTGADLRGADLTQAVLTAATLTDALVEGATFSENTLDSAILAGAEGLTEEQLQAALAVSPEALGAALLQHQVQLNRPNEIWSKLRPACNGQAVPGTAFHLGGSGVHPAVALDLGGATHPWTSRVAPPTALRSVELVACIGAEEEVLYANCGAYEIEPGPRGGEVIQVSRHQRQIPVRLVAAATGQVVWEEVIKGAPPRACELREFLTNFGSEQRIVGDAPTFETFELWLSRFVLQP